MHVRVTPSLKLIALVKVPEVAKVASTLVSLPTVAYAVVVWDGTYTNVVGVLRCRPDDLPWGNVPGLGYFGSRTMAANGPGPLG